MKKVITFLFVVTVLVAFNTSPVIPCCGITIFDFATDIQNWYINQQSVGGNCAVSWSSNNYHFDPAGGSLNVTLDLTGGDDMTWDYCLVQSEDWYQGKPPIGNFSLTKFFQVFVFVPDSVFTGEGGLMGNIFVKTGNDWEYYEAPEWKHLYPGWNALTLDCSDAQCWGPPPFRGSIKNLDLLQAAGVCLGCDKNQVVNVSVDYYISLCGPVGVESSSWGKIKNIFKE